MGMVRAADWKSVGCEAVRDRTSRCGAQLRLGEYHLRKP